MTPDVKSPARHDACTLRLHRGLPQALALAASWERTPSTNVLMPLTLHKPPRNTKQKSQAPIEIPARVPTFATASSSLRWVPATGVRVPHPMRSFIAHGWEGTHSISRLCISIP